MSKRVGVYVKGISFHNLSLWKHLWWRWKFFCPWNSVCEALRSLLGLSLQPDVATRSVAVTRHRLSFTEGMRMAPKSSDKGITQIVSNGSGGNQCQSFDDSAQLHDFFTSSNLGLAFYFAFCHEETYPLRCARILSSGLHWFLFLVVFAPLAISAPLLCHCLGPSWA